MILLENVILYFLLRISKPISKLFKNQNFFLEINHFFQKVLVTWKQTFL